MLNQSVTNRKIAHSCYYVQHLFEKVHMEATSSNEPRALADQIADALGENALQPRKQIMRIIRLCGAEQTRTWFAEAQAIEASGGC
jgi:hypothetical protein